jgi:hypothetical protein
MNKNIEVVEELDAEAALAKKLDAARKEREEERAAQAPKEAAPVETPETQQDPAPMMGLDEKELLYEGLEKMGCSRNYLVKMKERHGTIIVYPHEDGNWFVIRPLKVKEMKMIREIVENDAEKLNKEILESAVVFPKLTEETVNELPAGLPDLLVNMISRLSAFIPVELAFTLSKEL